MANVVGDFGERHRNGPQLTVGTDEWEITIAPRDPNWTLDSQVTLNYPLTILSSGAHMHLRGRDMTFVAHFPDGRSETVLAARAMDLQERHLQQILDHRFVAETTQQKAVHPWCEPPEQLVEGTLIALDVGAHQGFFGFVYLHLNLRRIGHGRYGPAGGPRWSVTRRAMLATDYP